MLHFKSMSNKVNYFLKKNELFLNRLFGLFHQLNISGIS